MTAKTIRVLIEDLVHICLQFPDDKLSNNSGWICSISSC